MSGCIILIDEDRQGLVEHGRCKANCQVTMMHGDVAAIKTSAIFFFNNFPTQIKQATLATSKASKMNR